MSQQRAGTPASPQAAQPAPAKPAGDPAAASAKEAAPAKPAGDPAAASAKEAAAPSYVLEDKKRLSESLLWALQRAFYASTGPGAWKPKGVPFYVTSNPYIAKAYARIVVGFLRDLVGSGALHREHPLHVVELAAGSGKFSYLFLRALRELLGALPVLEGVRLRYVMTDFADRNLAAWQRNSRLIELAEEGVLDFAVLDIERDRQVRLVRSGETLAKGALKNPLVSLANYAFDTTVHDAFFVKQGVLHEGRAALVSSQQENDPNDPAVLERASLRFEPVPVQGSYYDDPLLNRVLDRYRQRLGDTSFLIPIGALRGIRTLREWADGRLLLLCGDKGVSYEEDLLGRADPRFEFHGGSVSMMVNLNALGTYFEELGGGVLHGPHRDNRLRISALLSGIGAVPETRLAFREATDGLTPSQYPYLMMDLRKDYANPSFETIMAFLRLSEWDPEVLSSWREALTQHLGSAGEGQKAEMLRAMRRLLDNFYPMQRNLALELAGICLAMREGREALHYCRESLRLFGDHHVTWFSCGVAHTLLGEDADAVRCLQKVLSLEPSNGGARELLIRMEAKLAGR
jgi:tetratricopeptide (TPR) repeat protein